MNSKNQQSEPVPNKKVPVIIPLFILIAVFVSPYFIFMKRKAFSMEGRERTKLNQSIAVLPFVNMSSEPGQEYFSDGLTEGILNSLAQLKGLKVTARTSSFKFKGTDTNIQEIGKLLGVRTVLEGSVQRQGDRIRITAQLINVEDDFHFWSEQYDEKIDDVFALQDKIAEAIAEKLSITLLNSQRQILTKKQTASKEAYELYLKGRSLWNLKTPPDLKQGIVFFQEAIALDSQYAAAYAGVADCYTALGYGSHLPPKVAFPKAFEAAMKALKLDSTLADPHATLGCYRFYYDWDWAAAEQEFRTSIALNPNYEIAYGWYGYYLTSMERYDEARVILEKAAALDPLSAPISTDIGFSLYYSGAYEEAIKQLNASLEINPNYHLGRIWLGRAYQAKKMYPEAIVEYKRALEVTPEWPVALAQIGNVYGVSGNKEEAKKVLESLTRLAEKKFVTSYGVGLVYAGLDEKDQAFRWLNEAYEEHSHWLVWLKTDPRWASLRGEKQFAELVARVGLPHVNE